MISGVCSACLTSCSENCLVCSFRPLILHRLPGRDSPAIQPAAIVVTDRPGKPALQSGPSVSAAQSVADCIAGVRPPVSSLSVQAVPVSPLPLFGLSQWSFSSVVTLAGLIAFDQRKQPCRDLLNRASRCFQLRQRVSNKIPATSKNHQCFCVFIFLLENCWNLFLW